MQALNRAPLFEGLSCRAGPARAGNEDLEVSAGEVPCRERETGHEFFVIVEGKTDVTSKGKRVASGGDGDFFCETALLDDTKRTATVTAKTPLRLFVLTRQELRQLVVASSLGHDGTGEHRLLRWKERHLLGNGPRYRKGRPPGAPIDHAQTCASPGRKRARRIARHALLQLVRSERRMAASGDDRVAGRSATLRHQQG